MAATWRRRLCATTPKASAASSSIGLADDLYHPRKLVDHARRLRQPLPGLRGGNGLQRRPSTYRETFTELVNKFEAELLDEQSCATPLPAKTSRSCSTAEHWSIGCATRTMSSPYYALRRI